MAKHFRITQEPIVPVAAQPLAANVTQSVAALEFLAASLPADARDSLRLTAAEMFRRRAGEEREGT